MTGDIFSKEPLAFHKTIPMFSLQNEYTANYEQIASDHLTAIEQGQANPFIQQDLWLQTENSTIELIRKYAKAGDMILDVGVGLGRLLSGFADLQRYGIDISLGYLEVAQAKGIHVSYALIEDMPYREELFDIVTCTDVLEHVIDLNLACAKILAVLKKGGFLIVRVPYREDLSKYVDPACPYKYTHLRNFDKNSLQLLFERIFNCNVIEMTTAGYAPSPTRLKYPLPAPKSNGVLVRIIAALLPGIKKATGPIYQKLLRTLTHPVEINIVVEKK